MCASFFRFFGVMYILEQTRFTVYGKKKNKKNGNCKITDVPQLLIIINLLLFFWLYKFYGNRWNPTWHKKCVFFGSLYIIKPDLEVTIVSIWDIKTTDDLYKTYIRKNWKRKKMLNTAYPFSITETSCWIMWIKEGRRKKDERKKKGSKKKQHKRLKEGRKEKGRKKRKRKKEAWLSFVT